ncbi:Arabinogalactan peptide 23 [Rhynchospora pubera]|uniref:Arabinogalactan peptide 23 n=1 Tax=Rhynchospora pubera TaxID=906938 RepID=A0AAV8CR36_9POAL|nr:Arabinogalactan peptide 23 [Rhynchospora pubera]
MVTTAASFHPPRYKNHPSSPLSFKPAKHKRKRASFLSTSKVLITRQVSKTKLIAMEMKKVACALLFVAASATAALASEAPAPSPTSGAFSASAPALGTIVGASIVSFVAYYLN